MSYNTQSLSEDDKRIKRRNIDRELLILTSNRSGLERRLDAMRIDLRLLRQKKQQVAMDIEAKEKEIEKAEKESWSLEQEEIRFKKRRGEME